MKKIVTIAIIILIPFALHAQQYHLPDGKSISREFIDIPAIILVVYIFTKFILSIIHKILDYRLKLRMTDKGVSDEVVKQFLQPDKKDNKNEAMKWFILFSGIGIGLSVISFYLPLGIHSFAIMSFSIALSFLAYYFFIRQSGN